MQTFAEWLDKQLIERNWTAADLTAASRDDENPRGLDSGLISRWRRKDALAVVPTQAKTLTRLARALAVPESEVYIAAGLEKEPSSNPVQSELETRLARLGATLAQYPRAVWMAVLEANDRMAEALAHSADPPVSAPETGRVSAASRRATRGNGAQGPPLAPRSYAALPVHAW